MEPTTTDLTVSIERLVAGGAGLAHEPSGRVVMVDGALPGERVEVRLVDERARMSTATVLAVSDRSATRIDPPCPAVAAGCGGCDLQHAAPEAQPTLKAGIVADSLSRAVRRGDLDDVPIHVGPAAPSRRYRSTVRCAVDGDRLAFRRRRSAALLVVDDCLVADDPVAEVIRDGRFPGADEVTIRSGARTGERLVVVDPVASEDIDVPEGVRVVGLDELRSGRRAWYHEVVAGQRFRISALSFFQSGADGADELVDAVGRAVGGVAPAERLVDLYGGVGLFSRCLGAVEPILVERSASSAADARVNLADSGARVVVSAVERWRASAADVVVADPPRSGLGAVGVEAVTSTGADRVALVSCDVASLVRDLVLLGASGYRATGVEVVDLFPNTHHVETVTALERL